MKLLVDNVAKKRPNKNKRWKHVNVMSTRQGISENVDPSGSRGGPGRVVGQRIAVDIFLTVAVQGH